MFLEQIKLHTENTPIVSCAFTGHRELFSDFSPRSLRKAVKVMIEKGCKKFFCGMAAGFDLYAAEAVLIAKRKYKDVVLVACLPCQQQDKYYGPEDKRRYQKLLKLADETLMLSQEYYKGCMLARDRYMADNADALIAYLRKETGGTAYTVRYMQKNYPNKKVLFL